MQNKKAEGLGVPLPSGQAAVFEPVGGRDMLVGEGAMRDHAVGEKVDFVIGESSQVRIDVENFVPPKNRQHDYCITVTNANTHPDAVEQLGRETRRDRVSQYVKNQQATVYYKKISKQIQLKK